MKWIDKVFVISLVSLGLMVFAVMMMQWQYQGSPFLALPILPGYSPHGYKIISWVIAYFAFFRMRYGRRSIPMFMAAYGALEVFFNFSYLALHGGLQYGVYPYLDGEYPIRLSLYVTTLIVGLILARPRLSRPAGPLSLRAVKYTIIGYLLFVELGSIFLGYNVVLDGNFSVFNIISDFVGNALWLLAVWAIVY